MNIGIDIDGVILDFVRENKCMAEIYDLFELKGKGVQRKNELSVLDGFDWTKEQFDTFVSEYMLEISRTCGFISGVKKILEKLKEDGHNLIVITARGGYMIEMRTIVEDRFKDEQLPIDKYFWHRPDKLEVCQEEKIDLMIDDSYDVCKKLSEHNIKTIYFRDKDMPKLDESDFVKEVSNWGEIYRYILTLE